MQELDKTVDIGEFKYTIRIHPGEEGLETAYECNRLIGTAVYMSQQAVAGAFDDLTDDEKKSLAEGSEEEKTKKYLEVIVPKISPQKMLEAAIVMLRDLKPKEMAALSKQLFKYVVLSDKPNEPMNINIHFAGRYGSVIPLMSEVIQHNNFLDLDVTALLR